MVRGPRTLQTHFPHSTLLEKRNKPDNFSFKIAKSLATILYEHCAFLVPGGRILL
jgi:hypothetical protein